MEGANESTFRPTLTVWPAEPPGLPLVVAHELRRLPDEHRDEFTSWDPQPTPSPTVALPEDFCLRECLATDPADLAAVFDFVSRWGRLTPLEAHLRTPLDSLPASLNWLIPQLNDATQRAALSQIARATNEPESRTAHIHSLATEAHYLRVLHALAGHVIRNAAGQPPAEAWINAGFRDDDPEPWGTFVVTMNAALKPFAVHVRYPGADTLLDAPSTYEVAVLQLAELIAEERQVRSCANQRCTRLFTRQRGRAKYDKTGHATGVLYCSAQCAKAQAERNRRARKRAETNSDQAGQAN
jgi:hypothetical protein